MPVYDTLGILLKFIIQIICVSMLFIIGGDGMLIDAYFFELTAFVKLHCHDVYPP